MAGRDTEKDDTVKANKENEERHWAVAGPRTVTVPRADYGYGFTLRHFIVYPPELSSPEEEEEEDVDEEGHKRKRKKLSSLEPMDTIFVRQVKDGGPAYDAGLNTGDRIVSVNGVSVADMSYPQVIALIQNCDTSLKLLVVPQDEDILQMAYQNSAYHQGQEPYRGHANDIPHPPLSTARPMANKSPDDVPLLHGKPPPTTFKSELNMRPTHDITQREREAHSRRFPSKSSSGSLGSLSSDASGSSQRELSSYWPDTHGSNRTLTESHATAALPGVSESHGATSSDHTNPAPPIRTSSKNIVLSHMNYPDSRHCTSPESMSGSSDTSSSRRSQEDSRNHRDLANLRHDHEYSRQPNECNDNRTSGSCDNLHQRRQLSAKEAFLLRSGSDSQAMAKDAFLQSGNDGHSSDVASSSFYRHSSDSLLGQSNGQQVAHPAQPPMSKSATTGRLPLVGFRPVPYTRSHTTSSLNPFPLKSSGTVADHTNNTALCNQATASYYSSLPESSKNDLYPPGSSAEQIEASHDQLTSDNYGSSVAQRLNTASQLHNTLMNTFPTSAAEAKYNSAQLGEYNQPRSDLVCYQSPEKSNSLEKRNINLVTERMKRFEGYDQPDYKRTPSTDRSPSRYHKDTLSASTPAKMGCDSVRSRVAIFEGAVSDDSLSDSEWPRRTTASEERYMSRTPSDRKHSLDQASMQQTLPPSELHKMPGTPPATISIYFRKDTPPQQTAMVQPSPERLLQQSSKSQHHNREYTGMSEEPASHASQHYRDRSPLGSTCQSMSPSTSRRHKPALRQPSYLSAINSPFNKVTTAPIAVHEPFPEDDLRNPSPEPPTLSQYSAHVRPAVSTTFSREHFCGVTYALDTEDGGISPGTVARRAASFDQSVMPSSMESSIEPMETRPAHRSIPPPIVLRDQSEDRESKLVRRVSYLMATNSQLASSHEMSKSDSHLQPAPSSPQPPIVSSTPEAARSATDLSCILEESFVGLSYSANSSMNTKSEQKSAPSLCSTSDAAVAPPTSEELVPTTSGRTDSITSAASLLSGGGEKSRPVSAEVDPASGLRQLVSPVAPTAPGSSATTTTMTPTKTSNIRKLKAFFGERTPRIVETMADRSRVYDMPSGEAYKEGMLNCKLSITDGKRASDRSWKPVWTLLRGHALYLLRGERTSNTQAPQADEQPVSIKSCIVDIAHDYTKRRNVFRLTTYNGSEYLLQADDHETMMEWIRAIQANNNPDQDDKNVGSSDLIIRKTSAYDLKSQMSPQPERQKAAKKVSKTSLRSKSPAAYSPSSGFDPAKSKEMKDNKTWKGRMVKKFKRYGSSSSAPSEPSETSEVEVTGVFGVPLEFNPPAQYNEYVPWVVEICTRVIEERGLENQGIYRVPGNTGSVKFLQQELDQDPYSVDTDSDKWLDNNVVSSLLKSFFLKLPEPIITNELYEPMINANRTENPEKRMLRIKKVLHDMPDHNFETFRYMACHLSRVASMSEVNKMDPRNLAIVFGPTLVRKLEESMVSMVKDMTDQCRVVESILLHWEWFFSSWDVDDNVPVDETSQDVMPVSGMNQQLLSKAEYLEAGNREMTAKDLVSNILSAANRKIKRKDKSKGSLESGSIEIDSHSTGSEAYSERNIDHEIELAHLKEQLKQTSTSLTTTAAHTATATATTTTTTTTTTTQKEAQSERDTKVTSDQQQDGMFTAKMVCVKRKDSEGTALTSSMDERAQPKHVTKYPAFQPSDYRFPPVSTDKPMMRRYSEDVLSESQRRVDEDLLHRPSVGAGPPMSYSTQQHLRRLQMETDAMRQKDEERRQDHVRKLTKQAAEMKEDREFLHETPSETHHSFASIGTRLPDYSSKYTDFSSRSDTASITSDYSTTSSAATAGYDNKPHSTQQTHPPISAASSSDYSSSASPASLRHDHKVSAANQAAGYEGGKYFMISSTGQGRSRGHGRPGSGGAIRHSTCDDIELYRPSPRLHHVGFNQTHKVNKSTHPQEKPAPITFSARRIIEFEADRRSKLDRSGSMRRKASLDSLLDCYDDEIDGYASSESDRNSDLVSTLTATFDQKLKGLGDPKFRGEAPARTVSKHSSPLASSGQARSAVGVSRKDNPYDRRFGELWTLRGTEAKGGGVRSEGRDSDNKENIGVLSAMGSSSSSSSSSPSQKSSPTHKSSPISLQRDLSDRRLSSPKSESSPLSKREQISEPKSDYASALRKSSEKIFGSKERLLEIGTVSSGKVSSPQPQRRDPTERRRVRRRHTVGGENDLEHFKAVLAVTSPQSDDSRQSAWERLQPAVRDADTSPESRNISAWIRQERLRTTGSTPSLNTLLANESKTGQQALPRQRHRRAAPLDLPASDDQPDASLSPQPADSHSHPHPSSSYAASTASSSSFSSSASSSASSSKAPTFTFESAI